MSVALHVPRHGICTTCGRQSVGYLKEGSLREFVGECPRCGCSPFYMDYIGPWTENISKMSDADALAFVSELDDDAEIEVLFRVEYLGPNRDEILNALHDRYWDVHDGSPEGSARGRRMTLSELRAAWEDELSDDIARLRYLTLGRVPSA